MTIIGNFSATGTKSAVVNTTYGVRKLYAMESPDVRFYDEGRSKLNNGIANISLDPIFIETVEPDYQVYLTPEAKTQGIYVDEKAKEYFIAKGFNPTSNIPFAWQISALRKGYSSIRLDSERKEDLQITATIDDENKTTDVNIVNYNLNNGQTPNASGGNETASANSISGNAVNKIPKANNIKSSIENKITVAATDENKIINKIQEKTNLDKEKIKKAITFRRKESKVAEGGAFEPIETTGVKNYNGIFYSGFELQMIGSLGNETTNESYVETVANTTAKGTISNVPKDFIFKGGTESNSKDLMVINATSEQAVVNKLGFKQGKATIESIDGSVIIKLG